MFHYLLGQLKPLVIRQVEVNDDKFESHYTANARSIFREHSQGILNVASHFDFIFKLQFKDGLVQLRILIITFTDENCLFARA